MARFHVNPETGNTGSCRATKHCPFGDFEKDHYDTAIEAREAYEKSMKGFQTDFELEEDFIPKRSYIKPKTVVPPITLHKEIATIEIPYEELKPGDYLPNGSLIIGTTTTKSGKYIYFQTEDGDEEKYLKKDVASTREMEMTLQEGAYEQRQAELEFAREEIALNVLPRGIFKRLNPNSVQAKLAKLTGKYDKLVEEEKQKTDVKNPYTSAWYRLAATDAVKPNNGSDIDQYVLLMPLLLLDSGDSKEKAESKRLMRFLMNETQWYGNRALVPRKASRVLSAENLEYLKKLHEANPTNSVQQLLDD